MLRSMTAKMTGVASSSPPRHRMSIRALVVGLIGIVLPFMGPVALYLGVACVREIDAQPGRWSGRGLALGGLALGVVGTIELVLPVVMILILTARPA